MFKLMLAESSTGLGMLDSISSLAGSNLGQIHSVSNSLETNRAISANGFVLSLRVKESAMFFMTEN